MAMKPALFLLPLLAITSFHKPHPGTPPDSPHFTLQALAPGIWAAINNDNGGHGICNAGIIDLGDKTLIFDPFMNLDAAEDLKQAAVALTQKPVSLVVNSHFHNDHIRGNQLYVPATILSTEWTRSEITKVEPEELKWEKENAPAILNSYRKQVATATGTEKEELPLWIGYFEGMVKSAPMIRTTLPNITFSDSLWIHGKDRSVKLLEYRQGHTGSDIALLLPAEGIVFMGDLLFRNRHPWIADGNPKSWSQHLQQFLDNPNYQQFVPGHGTLCDKNSLAELIRYLNDLSRIVNEQLPTRPDSVILNTPVPKAYAHWAFRRFYKENLGFLCREGRAGGR